MKSAGRCPQVAHAADGRGIVANAGSSALVETIRAVGLDRRLSGALRPWLEPTAVHDPAKVLLDVAVSSAIGGDCLADVDQIRSLPAVHGLVASDATVSRTVAALAADAHRALAAISTARAAARATAWSLAGDRSPSARATARNPSVVDIDATPVTAHPDKELARPTFKKGFGHHPICAFVDHGQDGTGEPLDIHLRAGTAGSNTAADHAAPTKAASKQNPGIDPDRPGRRVLLRVDGAGATHDLLEQCVRWRVAHSVGFALPTDVEATLRKVPKDAWPPAYDADGKVHDGAFVAEATDLLNLHARPKGMRVIARKERPHPGTQLRITDVDGNRITAFATNTPTGRPGTQLADLELRHRRRARCQDRTRAAKDTGPVNLPLHGFDQNRLRYALVQLALDVTAWLHLLALHEHPARRWEPKRLRHRLFTIPARLASTARRTILHHTDTAPHVQLPIGALDAPHALRAPA